jgi:hypothetical protein
VARRPLGRLQRGRSNRSSYGELDTSAFHPRRVLPAGLGHCVPVWLTLDSLKAKILFLNSGGPKNLNN